MAKKLHQVTPEEWFAYTEYPGMMMVWLKNASSRKLRLFACASCRQVWDEMSAPARELVQAAAQWADGHIKRTELDALRARLDPQLTRNSTGWLERPEQAALATATPRKEALKRLLINVAIGKAGQYDGPGINRVHRHHADLLHDIFDDLFLPVKIAPTWLTADVVALARGIYDDEAFERLPILGDALQDAGCDDEHIMKHCAQAGPHVRGCWLLDRLLGQK